MEEYKHLDPIRLPCGAPVLSQQQSRKAVSLGSTLQGGASIWAITVSPLHRNLQVMNFQRCKHAFHPHRHERDHSRPPSPVAADPLICHLLQACPSVPVSVGQPLCGTAVLFKVLYCKLKHALLFVFFQFYLCEKYYTPIIVLYYRADWVSWVPQLILLDLWTNWTYKCALRTELILM